MRASAVRERDQRSREREQTDSEDHQRAVPMLDLAHFCPSFPE
jgi:hypothetical protein